MTYIWILDKSIIKKWICVSLQRRFQSLRQQNTTHARDVVVVIVLPCIIYF